MGEDCGEGRQARQLWLLGIAIIVQALPNGMLVGILLGIVSDFGLRLTVENMRANPEMFANQYALLVVCSAWLALLSLAVLVAIAGMQLAFVRRRPKKRPLAKS